MKRVLLGNGPGNALGLWVTKPGYDVLTASDTQFLQSPGIANLGAALTGVIHTTDPLPLAWSSSPYRTPEDTYGDYQTRCDCICGLYFAHSLGYAPIVWSDIQTSISATDPYSWNNPQDNTSVSIQYVRMMSNATYVGIEAAGYYVTHSDLYNHSFAIAGSVWLNSQVHWAALTAPIG